MIVTKFIPRLCPKKSKPAVSVIFGDAEGIQAFPKWKGVDGQCPQLRTKPDKFCFVSFPLS